MNWIEQAVDEHDQIDDMRTFASRKEAYRKSLRAVAEIASVDEVSELGDELREYITERGRCPAAKRARRAGARICRQNGYDVSMGSYLVK